MKRVISVLFLIVVITLFSININKSIENVLNNLNAFDYTYKTALYYGVNRERAILLARTIQEEYEQFPTIPYQVVVALIVSETGFKNIYGDNYKAVGYLQLHETATWYVYAFFPELKTDFKQLIYFPEKQIRIGYRYLYLITKYITNGNLLEALNYWNNNPNYYKRILYILDYIEQIIL